MSLAPSFFAFQPDEKMDQGFVRVLEQLAAQAHPLVRKSRTPLSESVHVARVLIKRLRALLWFASPAFASAKMRQAKMHLRKASRLLALQREHVVTGYILNELSQTTSRSSDRKALNQIAKAMDKKQAPTERPDRSLQQAVDILLKTIKQAKQGVGINCQWPSSKDRLKRAFRETGKAGRKALHGGDSAQFHDWRKKAKRLFYQLQLTQAVPGKRMMHTIRRVDKLQEKLGDYHDIVTAQTRLLKTQPAKASSLVVIRSVKLLEMRKRHLRKKVRKIAAHIRPK